jgi:hypothetical protein
MIFVTSIPKAGTHLLCQVIEYVVGTYPVSLKKGRAFEPGRFEDHPYLVGHFRREHLAGSDALFRLFARRAAVVLIRDPRDICNSMLRYLEREPAERYRAAARKLEGLDYPARIKAVAAGIRVAEMEFKIPSLVDACSGFLELRDLLPELVIVRYEDFFGDCVAADKLAPVLRCETRVARAAIERAVTTATRTKDVGQPQAWRRNFDEELAAYMRETYGDIIARLGYLP